MNDRRIDAPGGYVIEIRPWNPLQKLHEVEFVKIGRFDRNTLTAFKGLAKMAELVGVGLVARIRNNEKGAAKLALALGLKPAFHAGDTTTYMSC